MRAKELTLSNADKRSLQEWNDHCKYVMNSTRVRANETAGNKADRIKRAKTDYAFFVQEYFPHYATVDCAPFHIRLAEKIKRSKNLRAQARWFRGAAKSVHVDILIPMWLKIQDNRGYNTLVLVGANNDTADNLLGDLQAELQFNQRYIDDFGEQWQQGTWEEGNFTTKDGCAHFALGIGQKPRGLRKGAFRPDLIIIDDVDDDEMVNNESRVDKLVKWIQRSLIPTMDKGQGRVIQANNLIHEKSVTAKLAEKWLEAEKKLKETQKQLGRKLDTSATLEFYIDDVPIRNEESLPNWPAKYTVDDIIQLEIGEGYAVFESEYMNNPITEGKFFQKEWFVRGKLPPIATMQHVIAYLDGGFKSTGTSDAKSLLLIGLKAGKYYLYKAYCGKATVLQMIEWHYDLYAWLEARSAKAIWYMEEVFLLDLLYKDFAEQAIIKGFQIPMQGDKRKKPDKDLRIRSTQGIYQRGAVIWNQAEDNSHMKNLEAQYLAFEPPKKTLKDGPDAFEGAVHLLNEMVYISQPQISGSYKDLKSMHRGRRM